MNLELSIFVDSIQEMQFKYPELLWALFLLLIPLLIHLFQLRRFKKTPFTNVKLLKKVVAESRKSNTLKKWLLLFCRMILLAALIFSFAQPFFASDSALKKKESVIYLDDSFSMELKNDGATLLENAVQELIKYIPESERFSLFTNQKTFKNVFLADIQNDLLALRNTQEQLGLNEIILKGNSLFNNDGETENNLIILSDFQQLMSDSQTDSTGIVQKHLVQLSADEPQNVAIDSAYMNKESSGSSSLLVTLSTNNTEENIPVSLFNGDNLIAKTSAIFDENGTATVDFTIPENEVIKGKLEIMDSGLQYDNHLYFSIDEKEKIKVLSVGPLNSDYLKRIFSEDEFIFSSFSLKNLNYSDLANQNLIILNGLDNIPNSLSTSLKAFSLEGGDLTVIPSVEIDFNSYNLLVSNYFSTSYREKVAMESNITDISFSHPLYQGVFERNVTNFQYPKATGYFKIGSTAPSVLSFQNQDPFLIGNDGFFLFTAAISSDESNFKNSPLIVPTFYNMGRNSLKLSELYNVLGTNFTIDVPIALSKDRILEVSKADYNYIPRQQSLTNKVSLFFDENLSEDGIYEIREDKEPVKNIALNYDRKESDLFYLDINQLQSTSRPSSIASLFETMEKDNSVTELWKWFVILALLFLMVEILIQKYLK